MSDALPNYPNFYSNSSGDVAIRWTKWVSRFKNLMLACNITAQIRQRALLLHYVGEQTHDIFDTLPDTVATENENTLDKAVNALTAHSHQNATGNMRCIRSDRQNRTWMKTWQRTTHVWDNCQAHANSRTLTEKSKVKSSKIVLPAGLDAKHSVTQKWHCPD